MRKTRQSPNASDKGKPEPGAKPRRGNDFGAEGTNKTIAVPKADDGAEPEELVAIPRILKNRRTRAVDRGRTVALFSEARPARPRSAC